MPFPSSARSTPILPARHTRGLGETGQLGRLTGPLAPDRTLTAAPRGLSRGARVGQVAGDLGLLPRTVRRRFTADVGLTPKRFARVQRMQRLVQDLVGPTEVDGAAVAAGHGYSDQPHLGDEGREPAGVTPTEYLRPRMNGPDHLRFSSGTGHVRP